MGAPKLAFELKAPLRLNPAVRDALASILERLNGPPQASAVFTVAEGVFVPLSEFDRQGIQPGIAIRALLETGMLAHSQRTGPPTVTRETGAGPAIGVIVVPRFVSGLDPQAFAPQPQQAD